MTGFRFKTLPCLLVVRNVRYTHETSSDGPRDTLVSPRRTVLSMVVEKKFTGVGPGSRTKLYRRGRRLVRSSTTVPLIRPDLSLSLVSLCRPVVPNPHVPRDPITTKTPRPYCSNRLSGSDGSVKGSGPDCVCLSVCLFSKKIKKKKKKKKLHMEPISECLWS